MAPLTLPAFAKVNLDLRILGVRPDGYHDLRTVFQTLSLSDLLTFTAHKGPFVLECDDATLSTDHRNLVWKAASLLWQTVGPRRGDTPRDAIVQLSKRIPQSAGLGGGSADAAITLLGLAHVWKLNVDLPTLSRLATSLGADVPFFLVGGTALGLGRGDDIYPLVDLPRAHIVVVRPGFGISTIEAYRWYDTESRSATREWPRRAPVPMRLPHPGPRTLPPGWPEWASDLRNDLEAPVAAHHPTIARIKQALLEAGAIFAAMSGSGSAVYGVFDRIDAARRTARDLVRPGWSVVQSRTISRREYARRLAPVLARTRSSRIS